MADEQFKANAAAFYAQANDGLPDRQPAAQSLDNATEVFYGVEAKKRGLTLGHPIPGYSGHNRRIEADNIFGATYQASKVGAETSNQRIEFEKGETLKTTQQFMPSYAQARADRKF